MKNRRLMIALLLGAALGSLLAQGQAERADQLVQRTIAELGGKVFLEWKDFYGEGRVFTLKNEQQSWTKFWDYYQWPGKSRTAFEKPDGILEIYNLTLGQGWTYEYGKIKEKKEEEMRDIRLAEKRNLVNLFRVRWNEPGMKIFYYGPGDIDTLKPQEALEFVDAENYTVTVFFEEGMPRPLKIEYTDRTREGITLTKAEMFHRWFRIKGILTPKRVEFYTNNNQTGLLEYSVVDYNVGLAENLFTRPTPPAK